MNTGNHAKQRQRLAACQRQPALPLRQQNRERAAFAFAQDHAVADDDQQQWQQELIEIGRCQRGKPAHAGRRLGIGEHRRVLPVAFKEDRLPGHRINARIEHRKRWRQAESVMAVMYHPVRMAIRLRKERGLGAFLLGSALRLLVGQPVQRQRRRCRDQHGHNQRGGHHDARTQPQPPFPRRDPDHCCHAASRPAKAACTCSVSMRPSGPAAKLPTNRPPRSKPTRSATWHAP